MQLKFSDLISKDFYSLKLPSKDINETRNYINDFLNQITPNETEEYNKNVIRDLLIKLGYSSNQVNTSGRIDLAIDNDGYNNVIIETKDLKSPDMLTTSNINKKAIHELILYFMREYLVNKNNHITYLIATNGIEWFIFNAKDFKKIFIDDKSFVSDFMDTTNKSLTDSSTNNFYKQIASPKVEREIDNINYLHFSLAKEYSTKKISNNLISNIYKLFNPITMFKKAFISDSNALNVNFYNELLYIMGLEENKDGIVRVPKSKRENGSIVELVYIAISSYGNYVSPSEEFDDVINMSMSFINRILFLKLLEGQLIRFNNNNDNYKFLNNDNIKSFSDIDDLFFKVLAIPFDYRLDFLKEKYPYVPYLNSSLFELTSTEEKYDLSPIKFKNDFNLKTYEKSVLKKRISKDLHEMPTLEYLLDFLSSYSFSNTSNNGINNQQIINPSILGSIFEKINGYKDGSFFTPGFVTSYMAKTSIDRALINKFNRDGFNISQISDLIGQDRNVLKKELNDFHLVDPAVGSGHFLVSCLNYLVKIRNDLGLISPQINSNYNVRIVNDDLVIDNSELNDSFSYRRGLELSTEIQSALFNTKQEIIENNLFGVDINKNSVNITKLRLWIELLKNSYYKEGNLVTMPNLEMNIKSGNSIISRYNLDDPLSNVSQGTNITVAKFKKVVSEYKNTSDKNKKHQIEIDISTFKNSIIKSINKIGIEKMLRDAYQKYHNYKDSIELIKSQNIIDDNKFQLDEAKKEIKKLEKKKKQLSNNKLYNNSFEWRFEFPELLDSNGNFIGFDLVIANPPYINMDNMRNMFDRIKQTPLGLKYAGGRINIFYYFIHLAMNLLNSKKGVWAFITTNYWLSNDDSNRLRSDVKDRSHIFNIINFSDYRIFDSAMGQNNVIIESEKGNHSGKTNVIKTKRSGRATPLTFERIISGDDDKSYYGHIDSDKLYDSNGYINLSIGANIKVDGIISKLENEYDKIGNHVLVKMGIQAVPNRAFIIPRDNYSILKNDLTEFERSLMKPLINGSSIDNYFEHDNFNSYIMYITNDIYPKCIPNLIDYMVQKAPNIQKTASGNAKKNFYSLHRPRDLKRMQDPLTIFSARLNKKPLFMFNDERYVIKDDSRYIYPVDNSIDYRVLFILLNSTLSLFIWHYYGITRGISVNLKESALKVIPLPNLQSINMTDVTNVLNTLARNKPDTSTQMLIDNLVNDWFKINDKQFDIITTYIKNLGLK